MGLVAAEIAACSAESPHEYIQAAMYNTYIDGIPRMLYVFIHMWSYTNEITLTTFVVNL